MRGAGAVPGACVDAGDDAGGRTVPWHRLAIWTSFTRFFHLVKLDKEAAVKAHASTLLILGRTICSSTACTALVVPVSIRFAPSAIASVLTTRNASMSVRQSCMSRNATSKACPQRNMLVWHLLGTD